MKKIIIAIAVITLAVSCGSSETKGTKKDVAPTPPAKTKKPSNTLSANNKNIKEINVSQTSITKNTNKAEFAKLIAKKDGTLLDVRTPGECARGIIEGAINIDFRSKAFTELVGEKVDKNKPVYIYCQSGNRSTQAMNQMKKMGFKEIYNLMGGYGAWNN